MGVIEPHADLPASSFAYPLLTGVSMVGRAGKRHAFQDDLTLLVLDLQSALGGEP